MRSKKRFTLFTTLLVGAAIAAPAVSIAQGEHARRAGAELLVIIADGRKLADPSLSRQHKIGLKARINGGLAGLSLMMRFADQERSRSGENVTEKIKRLKASFQKNDLTEFSATVIALAERYPFKAKGILPIPPSADRNKRGKQIHEEHCAGCHDTPDLDVERPAFNLFQQAQTMPPPEFAARLVIGIRGDRVTGVDNPFSDEELAALFGYYKTAIRQDE